MKRTVMTMLAATLVLAMAGVGQAANGTWTQLTSGGLWSDTANWSGGTVAAGNTSTAFFDTLDITADNTLTLGADRTINKIVFGDTDTSSAAGWTIGSGNTLTLAGTTPTITVNALGTDKFAGISAVIAGTAGIIKAGAGTLTLSGANTYTGDTTVSAGTLTILNRTTAAGGLWAQAGYTLNIGAGNNFSIGASDYIVGGDAALSSPTQIAIVNHTGGTISASGSGLMLVVGAKTGPGEYNLDGGTLNIAFSGTAGVRGVLLGANANGTFNLISGTLNMTTAASGLQIGRFDATANNTINVFNQTGGSATIQRLSIGGAPGGSSGVNSTLSLTGGMFSAVSFDRIARGNTNTALIHIGGTADVTLPAFPTGALGTGSTATIEFDGGTLKNKVTSANYLGNISSAQIMAGGAKFNTAAGDITITHNLLTHATSLGGGLTKAGANTLTLSGNNSYTGDTIVEAGTLALSNANNNNIANSAQISVASGAILDVTGLAGASDLILASGQTLAVAGTVNGAVTVQNGATLGGTGTATGTLTVEAGGTMQPTLSGTPGTLTLSSATAPSFAAYSTLKLRVTSGTMGDKVALSSATPTFDCANLDLVIDTTDLAENVTGLTIVTTANAAGVVNTFNSVSANNGYGAIVHYFADSITIDLAPNAAPTDIALSATAVDENQPIGTTVGTLTTTDPDAGNTFTYTLVAGAGDTDNAAFSIDGDALKTGAVFDYETKSSYTVRVRTTDQGGLSWEEAFTIDINDVVEDPNAAPTDIALAPAAVDENQPIGTTVGTLTTTDPDAGNTFTYTLVAGAGDTDNAAFSIDGDALKTGAVFDYETKSSYTVRVRTTDQGGLWYEEAFTIGINDVVESPNAAPTDIALSATAVDENRPFGTTVGTLTTTDPDAGDTFTYTLVPGAGDTDNASFSIVGDALKTGAVFDYETKSSYSIRIRTTDQGGLWWEEAFTIDIGGRPINLVALGRANATYITSSTVLADRDGYKACNWVGMTGTFPTGTADTTTGVDWLTSAEGAAAWIAWDLGEVFTIDAMHVWNWNVNPLYLNRGVSGYHE
jgi:autotransporter-associated beta strand protein